MKDYSKNYPGRAFTVMFYADVDGLRVAQVQAYECPPNEALWVPEVGYSMFTGRSLHVTEAGAKVALQRGIKAEQKRLKARLKALARALEE